MGKIDDMRRQREAQLEAQREREARAAQVEPAAPAGEVAAERSAAPAEATLAAGAPARRKTKDTTGTCAACGKVRAVQGGLVAQHQKGLGTVCAGSRQAPAS